jgi:CMP-N,N'-diacetyllegionaminic acid synthase
MNVSVIILARGGSKGIPNKNIINFCDKPLISWTIEQCIDAGINKENIFVSSDSEQILKIGSEYGVGSILRTPEVSNDTSTSESSWIYSIDYLESNGIKSDWILAPQVTSPIRESSDIVNAISIARQGDYDSLFSAHKTFHCSLWEDTSEGLSSIGYDWKDRKRRQDSLTQYIENGSFYMFKPDLLRRYNNRMYGKIGVVEMEEWKSFEVDTFEDLKLCSVIMKNYLL